MFTIDRQPIPLSQPCSAWKPYIARLAIGVVASMTILTVHAGNITAVDLGGANFGAGSVGYRGVGAITPNPNSNTVPVNVMLGGDSMSTTDTSYDFSATGLFNTWCVDIYHWVNGSSIYTVATAADLANELAVRRPGTISGATRVADMISLADEVYGMVNDAQTSAAFQLALWEIAYGTPGNTGVFRINTSDSGFHVDAATVNASYGVMANLWLSQLQTAPIKYDYSLTYLSDARTENTQDMIVLTRTPPHNQTVPEPSTLLSMLAGFASMLTAIAMSWRRRRQVQGL